MTYPEELMYTKDHEWLRRRNSKARIGVSSYAVEQLGDVVHVDLPSVGTKVSEGEAFGTIESTKTVSDIYAPCNGTVIAVNEKLLDEPEAIAHNPYEDGWLIEIEMEGQENPNLMTSRKYMDYLQSEH
jgi:glycine cleavage system H protein